MTNTDRTVEQTNHRLIRDALRETLRAGLGAIEKVGSLRYRVQYRIVPAVARASH